MKKQELIDAHLLAFAVEEVRLNEQTIHLPMDKDGLTGTRAEENPWIITFGLHAGSGVGRPHSRIAGFQSAAS